MWLLLTFACRAPEAPAPVDPARSDTAPPPDTATLGATGDTAVAFTGDTAPVEPAFDCSAPWDNAPPVTTLTGWSRAEDFDFDGEGYVVAVVNRNLFGRDPYGNNKVVAPSISGWTAGTRVLSTGDWVVADPENGSVVLITTATGAKTEILGGVAYPNGIEVDAEHNVYIGENDGDRVLRVNAYDPTDLEVVARDIREPNGVILSPDGQTLYVGSFGGGVIYAVDRDPAGGWMPHRVFYDPPVRDGGFDGINVDACGNVYITEFVKGKVYRVAPDASRVFEIADLPSSWIPNLRWGVGVAGWDPDTLYVSDRDQGRLFAIDVGIPGKPHLLAP
jgi:sugar lactone lactonase YvrE